MSERQCITTSVEGNNTGAVDGVRNTNAVPRKTHYKRKKRPKNSKIDCGNLREFIPGMVSTDTQTKKKTWSKEKDNGK